MWKNLESLDARSGKSEGNLEGNLGNERKFNFCMDVPTPGVHTRHWRISPDNHPKMTQNTRHCFQFLNPVYISYNYCIQNSVEPISDIKNLPKGGGPPLAPPPPDVFGIPGAQKSRIK